MEFKKRFAVHLPMKSMMSKFKKYSWLLLWLLCSGCIKEISFELGKQEDEVVIYGILADQPGKHLFHVSRTSAFEKQVTESISGATLLVQDSKANKYPFVELSGGTYMLKDTLFRATAGEQYQLDVTLPGGEHYRSDVEVMPNPVKVERAYPGVDADERTYDQEFLVFTDVKIPADPNGVYLRWEVSRVWRRTSIDFGALFMNYFLYPTFPICYMTEDPEPNAIRIFGSKRRDAFDLRQQEVARIEADYRFFERNAFEIIQYRISARNYEYWNKINLVGNPQGTIFDVPPASVRGNIYNVDDPKKRILGYFEVAAVDTAYTYTERDIFRYSIEDPCRRDFTKQEWARTHYFHPECAYCTNIKGYSETVPKFW